jgi:hypothetical protein
MSGGRCVYSTVAKRRQSQCQAKGGSNVSKPAEMMPYSVRCQNGEVKIGE